MTDNGIRAINTLIEGAIQNLEYTSTETGTIIGVDLAQNGIYTVRVNGTSYRAYSALHDLQLEDSVIIANQQDDVGVIKIILYKTVDIQEDNNAKVNNISFLANENRIVAQKTDELRNYLINQNGNILTNYAIQFNNLSVWKAQDPPPNNSPMRPFWNLKQLFINLQNSLMSWLNNIPTNIKDFSKEDLKNFLQKNMVLESISPFKYTYLLGWQDNKWILNSTTYYNFFNNNLDVALFIPKLIAGNSLILDLSCDFLFDFYNTGFQSSVIPEYYIDIQFFDSENNILGTREIPLLSNSIGNIFDYSTSPNHFNSQIDIPKNFLFNDNNELIADKIFIYFKSKFYNQNLDFAESLSNKILEEYNNLINQQDYQDRILEEYNNLINQQDYQEYAEEKKDELFYALVNSYLNFPAFCIWPISLSFKFGALTTLPNLILIPKEIDINGSQIVQALPDGINFLESLQKQYIILDDKEKTKIHFALQFFNNSDDFNLSLINSLYRQTSTTGDNHYKKITYYDNYDGQTNTNLSWYEKNNSGTYVYDGINKNDLKFFISLNGENFIEDKINSDTLKGEFFEFSFYNNDVNNDYIDILTYMLDGILNIDLNKYESYSFYIEYKINGNIYKSNILTYMTQEEAKTQQAAALGYTINISLANYNIFTSYNSIDPSIYENQQHIGQIGLYHAGVAVKSNEIQSIKWWVPGETDNGANSLNDYNSQIWLFEKEENRKSMPKPTFELDNSVPSIGFQIFDRFVFEKTKINCEVILNNGQVLKLRTYLKLNYIQPIFNGQYAITNIVKNHKYPIIFYKLVKAPDQQKFDSNATFQCSELDYKTCLLDKETNDIVTLGNDQNYTDELNKDYSPNGFFSSFINYIFLSGSESIPYSDPIDLNNYQYFINNYSNSNSIESSNKTSLCIELNLTTDFSDNNPNVTAIKNQFISLFTDYNNLNLWSGRYAVLEIPTTLGWKYNLPKEYIIANEVERINGAEYFYQDDDQYINITKENNFYKQVNISSKEDFNSQTYSDNGQIYSNSNEIFYTKNSSNIYIKATSYSENATYYIANAEIVRSIPLILSYCYDDSETYQKTTDQVYKANKKYYKFVNTNATGANHYIFDPDTGLYSISSNGTFIRQQYREAEEFISNNLYEQIKVFRRIDKENLTKMPDYKAEKINKFIQAFGAYDQNQTYYIQKYNTGNYVKLNGVSDTDFNIPSDNTSPLIIQTEVSWKYSSERNYYQKNGSSYSIIKYADNYAEMPSGFNNPTADRFIFENNKLYYIPPNTNTKTLCYQTQYCYTMNIEYNKETTFSNNREYYTKNNGVYTLVKNPISSDVNNYYYQINDYYQRLGNYYILSSDREFKNDTDYYIISSTTNAERLNTKVLYKEVDQDQPEEAYSATEIFYPILVNTARSDINVLNDCSGSGVTYENVLTERDFNFTQEVEKYGGFYKRFATEIWNTNQPAPDLILIANNINKPGPNDIAYQNKSITNYLTEINSNTNQSLDSIINYDTSSPGSTSNIQEATSVSDWLTAEEYSAIGANRLIAASSLPLVNVNNQLNFFGEYLECLNKSVDIKEQQLEDSLFIPRFKEREPKLSGGESVYNLPFWRRSPFQGIYYLANCTCYAWGRYAEVAARGDINKLKIGLAAASKLPTGNAGTWYSRAKKSGRCITRTASEFINAKNKKEYLGAVMSWSGGTGGYGHVGVVEKIEELNNQIVITISESWYRDHGTGIYMRGPTNIYQRAQFRYGSMALNGFILQ